MKEKNVCNLNRFPIRSRMTGYTLIELIITVTLLAIVLTGGTAIFFKSFRSSSISDVQTVVNNGLKSLDEMIERSLLYGTVIRVGDNNFRAECLASAIGISGNTLGVRDLYGGEAIYTFDPINYKVSSNSAIISNSDIKVTKLKFTWYCRSGVNDKMNILIEATSSATIGEGASGILNKDIFLLNSGVN